MNCEGTDGNNLNMSYVFRTPRGKSTVANIPTSAPYDTFVRALLERSAETDQDYDRSHNVNFQLSRLTLGVHRKFVQSPGRLVRRRTDVDRYVESWSDVDPSCRITPCGEKCSRLEVCEYDNNCRDCIMAKRSDVNFSNLAFVVLNGKVLGRNEYRNLTNEHSQSTSPETIHHITLRVRVRGGIDRQNRVGSKFGGGGVSSGQHQERDRKERLRQLALETVDLAKDPYLMRNHLGTYECKLCLTLHTNEG
jgi:hypothetical protein